MSVTKFRETCPACGHDKLKLTFMDAPGEECTKSRCNSDTEHLHASCRRCDWSSGMFTLEQQQAFDGLTGDEVKKAAEDSMSETLKKWMQKAAWPQPTLNPWETQPYIRIGQESTTGTVTIQPPLTSTGTNVPVTWGSIVP